MHRIVLVEDDPALRYLLKAELEANGPFKVVAEAQNGAEGIEAAKTHSGRLDLVLLDLSMPVMDGVAALPHIIAAAPRACVVVLTMRPRAEAEAQVLKLGAAAFLDKSLAAATLTQRLVKILKSRSLQDPRKARPSTKRARS